MSITKHFCSKGNHHWENEPSQTSAIHENGYGHPVLIPAVQAGEKSCTECEETLPVFRLGVVESCSEEFADVAVPSNYSTVKIENAPWEESTVDKNAFIERLPVLKK